MRHFPSRRRFLTEVGYGTLLATLGKAAVDLGFVSNAFAEDLDAPLEFGNMEPLVCALQETPLERLQSFVVERFKSGVPLTNLVAAAALANARTFGGEDYVGFHTFMALAPALNMSTLMPTGSEALPVLKVLYRNTQRIQGFGGRPSEVLRTVPPTNGPSHPDAEELRAMIRGKETQQAEQMLASLMSGDCQLGFDALMPSVQDNPEVHRTVLPYRAWEMRNIVGSEHALTLLRQSLRYCVRATSNRPNSEMSEQAAMLVKLFDEFKLAEKPPGTRHAEDGMIEQLSETFSTATPLDSARAAASALAEGFEPSAVGEAISLAASLLVLRDGGRLPQWEDKLKLAGSVHGDSVGVHASDAANAWRHLATASTGRNRFACLIIGAWQVARDRLASPNLMSEPLPAKYQIDRLSETDADRLVAQLEECIRSNLQGQATAIVHRYHQLSHPADRLFASLVRFAVSEDGALHAEKYFQTVWDDFHASRPSLRWRHLTSLARVTASEYGRPAAGQNEARELLGIS
jgi:hypothetical protein